MYNWGHGHQFDRIYFSNKLSFGNESSSPENAIDPLFFFSDRSLSQEIGSFYDLAESN